MPSIAQTDIPKPKSWEEFEDLIWDLYARRWKDPNADRYGRAGQRQHGVDICGRPPALGGRCAGVQCKRYALGTLTPAIIEREVEKAEGFQPPLAEYTIATTDSRDTAVQSFVLALCEQREAEGRFPVHVAFWDTLCGMLTDPANRDILQKHYGEWRWLFAAETTPVSPGSLARHDSSPTRAARWVDNLKTYKARMAERYGTTQIFGQARPVPLGQVFTDVYLLDRPAAFRRFDIQQLQKDPDLVRHAKRIPGPSLVTQPYAHRLVILGRPGVGKTTFLKQSVLEAADGKLDKVPVFVTLREWADTGWDLLPFIVEQFAICGFPDAGPFVQHLLRETDMPLVLFDGLDEVPQENRADTRAIAALKRFSEQYPRAQCLVTCRTAATDYTFEGFGYVEVADFTLEQIEAFVPRWFHAEPEKGKAFLQEIKKEQNRGMLQLARTPLLLAMLCLAFNETLRFPLRRVEIYQDALDSLLRTWDRSRSIHRDQLYRALSPERKQQLFAQIAAQSFEQAEYFLPQSRLEAYICDSLLEVPNTHSAEAAEVDGKWVLRSIETQHGILVERAHRIYSFVHLSFQEYYTACYFVDSSDKGALSRLLSHCSDARWREVILLAASLLDDADEFFLEFRRSIDALISRHKVLVVILRSAAKSADVQLSHGGISGRAASCFLLLSTIRLCSILSKVEGDINSHLHLCTQSRQAPARKRRHGRWKGPSYVEISRNDTVKSTRRLLLALDQTLSQARTIESTEVLDALDGVRNIDHAHAHALVQALVDARDLLVQWTGDEPEAANRLESLYQASGFQRAQVLVYAVDREDEDGLLEEASKAARSLRRILRKHLRGIAWEKVGREELKRLSTYLSTNQLLLECLDLAYVSNRQAIEASLLLPPGTWQPENLAK